MDCLDEFVFNGLSRELLLGAAGLAAAKENIPSYLDRLHAGFDFTRYRQLLGAANEFKLIFYTMVAEVIRFQEVVILKTA